MSRLICILAFVLVSIYDVTGRKAYAGTNADLLCGVWQNSKAQIRVEIYKKGQYYYGKVVWMKYPYRNGKPKTDWKNPDPSKRNRHEWFCI